VPSALTVDSGHLWVAEDLNDGSKRVDRFDAASGAFLPPQLDEEGGVSQLGQGVAVGHAGGEEETYVGAAKEGRGVVAVFGPSGELQHAWTGAGTATKSFTEHEGEPAGTLNGVAADSSANLETKGELYIATRSLFGGPAEFNVVDVFRPTAGGEEPATALTSLKGTCAVIDTSCPAEPVPFQGPQGIAVSGFNGDVLVSDREREPVVDIFEPQPLGEFKYLGQLTQTPTGPLGASVPFERVASVAVDGKNGDIYVVDSVSGGRQVVDQFSASGEYLGRLAGTPLGGFVSLQSVAVDPASEHLYVGDYNSEKRVGSVDVFGASIVIPDVTPGLVSDETPSSATLNGTVGLAGEGPASCQFVWGTTRAFGEVAACEPAVVSIEESPVHAKLSGLRPDTTYFYRLQASNKNGTDPGEESQDGQFTTPGPGLLDESVSDIAATSATLHATISPHGAPTGYYFEYGTSAAYGSQAPGEPGSFIGSGEVGAEVEQHVQGLAPTTVYHYRVVAVSQLGGKPVSFPGADQTFITQGAGGGTLPDARQWDLVSPAAKHGALLLPISEDGLAQASASGTAITYLATSPTESDGKGNAEDVQIISSRDSSGWSSKDIALPHTSPTGPSGAVIGLEYRFFTEDLSLSLVEPRGEFTSLTPEASPPDSERTPYLRHDQTCAAAPASCFEPLLTGAAGYADVPPGIEFGGDRANSLVDEEVRFVGAAPDLSHVILSSQLALTGQALGAPGLYEWTAARPAADRLQLISVLHGGEAASGQVKLGYENLLARHAISSDGSRVAWSAEGHLYLRDTAKGQTVKLDGVQPGGCEGCGSEPKFQLASADAKRWFFTDSQKLVAGAGALSGQPDLYECEIVETEGGELQCKLTDITPLVGAANADVQGALLGASEDATTLSFVAAGLLTSGENVQHEHATRGAMNLYSIKQDPASGKWQTPQYISTLSSEDSPDWGSEELSLSTQGLTARVSPDGRWLTFMSSRSLTGYNNHDANSGYPDEEVYLYDNQTARLVCASCNPTGARPTGTEYGKEGSHLPLVGGSVVWNPSTWLAANIPTWTAFSQSVARYQSRYLSDSGRLFFNSADALVPRDINKNEDVYQYEPPGTGSCTPTSPTYSGTSGGCTDLISSGTAAGESAFIDASENGDDAFFLTGEPLAPQDTDTALDLYDAHVCSASAPCTTVSATPPACTTADACRSAPAPQPDIFGPPPSATFSGASNTPPATATVTPKRLTRTQQLAKAVSTCRHRYRHSKKRRYACERQARKHLGVHANAKSRKASNDRKVR
jgi:hypothetical protein